MAQRELTKEQVKQRRRELAIKRLGPVYGKAYADLEELNTAALELGFEAGYGGDIIKAAYYAGTLEEAQETLQGICGAKEVPPQAMKALAMLWEATRTDWAREVHRAEYEYRMRYWREHPDD